MAALTGMLRALWLVVALAGMTQERAPSREYQLKAVFLFNFAQFVQWPESAFPAPASPLVIGVLGDDPFGGFLDTTVQGETINNHPIEVRRYRSVEDVRLCHILFVARTEQSHAEQIVQRLRDRTILTVGESGDFARHGGMIQFVTENNRIRLRINLQAAQSANLTLSSKLLRPAEVVSGGGR